MRFTCKENNQAMSQAEDEQPPNEEEMAATEEQLGGGASGTVSRGLGEKGGYGSVTAFAKEAARMKTRKLRACVTRLTKCCSVAVV